MKKTAFTFSLTLFSVALSFGQSVKISEPYTAPKSTSNFYHHNGQVITESQFTGKPGTIEHYELEDNGLQYRGKSQSLEARGTLEKFQFETRSGALVNRLLWTYEERKPLLVKTVYSIDEAKEIAFHEPVVELTNIGFLTGLDPGVRTSASYDSSLLVVSYKHVPKIKENRLNKDVVEYVLLTRDFEVLSREKVEMPYTETEMQFLGSCVNDDGVVFSIIFCTKSGEEGLKLLILKEGEQVVHPIPWDFQNRVPRKLVVKENANGGVVLAGLFSDVENAENGYDGIFGINVSEEGEIQTTYAHEFPTNLILKGKNQKYADAMLEKQRKGENLNVRFLSLDEIRIHSDNSVTFLFEAAWSGDYMTYGDIYIGHIENDGELKWMHKVAKNQSGGGFNFDFDADRLNIFYMDHPLNKERAEGEGIERFVISAYDGDLIWEHIDLSTGQAHKKVIFNQKSEYESRLTQLAVGKMIKLEEGKYAMEAILKKNTKVMVTFTVD